MSYPQQPGNWSDPSWPTPNQPYSDPGYQGYPGYPASVPVAPVAHVDPGYGGYGYGYGPAVVSRPTNGMAIGAMVTSIASVVTCLFFPGIVGAILGHVARRQIRERGDSGDGMALAGVIIGWIAFAIFIVVAIAYIALAILAIGAAESYEPAPTVT